MGTWSPLFVSHKQCLLLMHNISNMSLKYFAQWGKCAVLTFHSTSLQSEMANCPSAIPLVAIWFSLKTSPPGLFACLYLSCGPACPPSMPLGNILSVPQRSKTHGDLYQPIYLPSFFTRPPSKFQNRVCHAFKHFSLSSSYQQRR